MYKFRGALFGITVFMIALWLVGFGSDGVLRAESAWPKRDVTIIVPYNPGGGYDIAARITAPLLAKYLPNKINVIVQNVPGAGGKIGTLQMIKAKPDGYTLCIQDPLSLAIMAKEGHMGSVAPESITYLAQLTEAGSLMATRSGSEFKTIENMKGKDVRFAVVMDNTMGSIALANVLGTKPTLITYNGIPECCLAVARGDADTMWSLIGSVKRQIGALEGKLKPVLIIGGAGDPSLPDVPTARELGLKLEEGAFIYIHGIVGPPNMPEDVQRVLREAIDKAMRDPEFAPRITKAGYPAVPLLWPDLQKVVDRAINVVEKYKEFLPKK